MSLRFVYGRSGSGKSHFCIESIKKKVEDEVEYPLIYLVPEQYSFQSEKNILNAIGEKSNLNVTVISFKRMAFRVMNEVGGITRKRIDSSGKCMLISHIVDKILEELSAFRRAAVQKGFINTLSDSISEFKRYSVTPELLLKTAEDIEEGISLKDKLLDLGKIYGEFETLLHKNYIDSDDDLTLLSEKLEESKVFNNAEIWIDEFYSFTPQQYKIIEKLLKKSRRVNITLTSDYVDGKNYGTDIFQFTKGTEDRILEIARNNNIKLDKPIVLAKRPFYRFKDSREISFLEKNLFAFPYGKYKYKTSDLKLFRAQNTYSEIESTARDIIRICRDEGYRYKDIAVITRDLENYETLVASIFEEHGIPYFIDEKRNIEGNLIVVLITSAIEIITKNWSYESVFRYLKTGLTNVDIEDVDVLENYVLASGIKGKKKWIDEESWDYRPDSLFGKDQISIEEEEFLDKINSIKKVVIVPLKKLYKNTRGKKSGEEICRIVFNFLNDINASEKVENLIEMFKNSKNQTLANEYSQIWNIIMDLLDQTVEVMGDMPLNLEEFEKIMSIGFREHKMGLIPPSVDQVLVGSVDRLKSHNICILYLIGVNDGVFPAVNNEEGILNDMERELLKNKGVELAKNTRAAAFEEQFLVYTTLTIPGKYLRISYPMADYEGNTLRPSIIVSRLKNIYPNITEESDLIFSESDEDRLKLVDAKRPTFNQLVYILRKRLDENNDALFWRDVYKWFSSDEYWREKCKRAFSGAAYTNQTELINSEKVRKLYGDNVHINVSRMEKYAQCPFAYYVQYGLNARERKIFKLTYPDIGTFMHKVIDEFSEKVRTQQLSWDNIEEKWCEENISNIVDNNLKKSNSFILNSSPRYRYFTERLKRVLIKTVIVMTTHIKMSGFKPIGYEMDFSEKGAYPPIVVQLPSGEEIKLIGRIDRIDMLVKEGETYIRIIDYKSGSKLFRLSEVYYGLQVQLLLYLDAILTQEGKDFDKKPIPGAILYFKIDDPLIKTSKDLGDDDLTKEIMKKFKMKGLLIDDLEIIREMDREMEGNSFIIPARINKDGSLGKSQAASKEQFELLRNHVKNVIAKNCENMLRGNISIKPCKSKDSKPCDFCMYSSICTFDESLEDNSYRFIYDKSDEEVWNLIYKEYGKEGENDGE
ncbi:ATP-dependent helicase/deoxyribonuclease subunit B [Clostridium pasteurianum DSM 525 = ATCC 6013]|uniref:ATP-dependent helicase/deoxyribonuclease subunit B n=1 Tax=Clostridium pasteurianum DSM 525 = ATCC 6013 TaxID=1262449 RepID=A0A0H3J577_CLOPA|nr:helicase-exonuclease AddAB subunit AddB [Clostridium pasteurianum]AJA48282.1 ATP-dependent helicase/deoxyribonuclease subunit B [Clostridium pasteurianum DSM 525 = ATCC 6013]AJA52270.1 ATP-dependent helicase/deoxyribonuclease subunit B [Clostridium pasteurianum DSM 525 = ATCC 6013]AOZ75534.1 ATP-dependent helicase [Clostridium pasteurianum DSM 525 = ATCC 6013]AOZ79329.1 ATP-dependent helicase [Clostridium pasteurianum]ELP60568.1 ATP-dependent exonuclease synthesis protein AddB (superfamily 